MVGVEMIQEFYYGTSWKWPIQYLPRVMITASYLDARKKKVEIEKPYMVDRGVGKEFSSLTKNPIISVHRYAELLRRQQPQIASTFDYPCEPDLRKKRGYTCIEAQSMTNENTRILLKEFPDAIFNVLQGWTVSEYLENLDMIKEDGLLTERLGIGSICRRGQLSKIVEIIRVIKRNVPSWVKLHGFGVKIDVLTTYAKYDLYSADSQAWAIAAFGRYANNGKGQTGWSIKEKLPYLLSYIDRIESLIAPHPEQTLLEVLE